MSTITFAANNTSGISPFYVTFYDLSDVSDLTTENNYSRTWIFVNSRTLETSVETTTSAGFNHKFEGLLDDTYSVTLSALHVSANNTLSNYIHLRGIEEPYRFEENREIDLQPYLPSYLKETEVNDLVNFFQNFLNTLYDEKIRTTSASDYEQSNIPKISIIEKINRLAELQDPSLIDIEYIQFFANNLGYSVDLSRGELGILEDNDSSDPLVQENVKRYLRFVVSNLSSWYKIQTTENAIKIMLYSFGLIGDLITRYTNDYRKDNGGNWLNFREGRDSFENMPNDFYPTSHFVVSVELDESLKNFSINNSTRLNVLNAIESIRPINTVSDGVLGHIHRDYTVYMRAYIRQRAYFRFNLS